MMNILDMVLAVVWLGLFVAGIVRYERYIVHMFQENSYKPREYMEWLRVHSNVGRLLGKRVPTERLCRELCEMFSERLEIEGRIIARKRASVLYFKESEHIEDILTLIGAPKSSLELMNVKIYRDIRNRVNRATNCDTANCGRQNRSALRQIDAINKIKASEGGLSKLPDELAELAKLRLRNPEMSLSELCSLFEPPLSRSGVNHRFMRIEQIAKETEE